MRMVEVCGVVALAVVLAGTGAAFGSTAAQLETGGAGTYTLDGNDGAGKASPAVITAILSQGTSTAGVSNIVNGKTYTSWAFLANDGTGSIEVFGKLPATDTSYTPTVGDAISVSGSYAPYNEIPELSLGTTSTITQGTTGNPVPAPVVRTIPQLTLTTMTLGSGTEAVGEYLVEVDNVTISGITGATTFGTANLTGTMTDSSSNGMTLYYWPTSYSAANTNLDGMTIPTGPVNIIGIADVFGGTSPEFIPLSITAAVPEPASLALLGLAGLGLLVRRRAAR